VVVAGAGVAFHTSASRNFKDFDQRFRKLPCAGRGCQDIAIVPELSNQLTRARREQQIAVASYVAGGSLIAAAVFFLYLNQRSIEQRVDRSATAHITAAPAVSGNMFGIFVGLSY